MNKRLLSICACTFQETMTSFRNHTPCCHQIVREKILPALIPTLTEIVATSFPCPPGIATLLSTPIAIYIQEEGMDKFCQISTDD